eukprot:TRINITY_DN21163_c0_g4_i1.p2 TRINITY_DN21163_c0_g4~~TRINITY_DN21163_c0_g4_i1.p2  ORF type:complete len:192 (-),score=42.40 TRINITY_DN21163_c0_g4_i1:134-709(-)
MSWCERPLHDHINCVKKFLRDARTQEMPYTPGSYTEFDKCAETRQAYVDCVHGPRQKVEPRGIPRVSSQAQPLDFYKHTQTTGEPAQEDAASQAGDSSTSRPPPVCEMELNIHGKCVENYLRNSITKGQDYIFLGADGVDKCAHSRTAFDQCIKGNKELAEGKKKDTHWAPWDSLKVAKHFSIGGSWTPEK